MRTQRQQAPRNDPARYASAVIRVLAEDFTADLNDPYATEIVMAAIQRNVREPNHTLEVIVDNPASANWRLKADQQDPRRVRLSCYRLNESEADREREQRINMALGAIEL